MDIQKERCKRKFMQNPDMFKQIKETSKLNVREISEAQHLRLFPAWLGFSTKPTQYRLKYSMNLVKIQNISLTTITMLETTE